MEESKKIEISGTANRYALKKLINNNKNEKEIKKELLQKNGILKMNVMNMHIK